MTNNFYLIEETFPNGNLYIKCKECWWAENTPNTHTHGRPNCEDTDGLTVDEAEKLASELEATQVHGQRCRQFDCKHVTA
jgi:hypothetical protein